MAQKIEKQLKATVEKILNKKPQPLPVHLPVQVLKLAHKLMTPYCNVNHVQRREFPPYAALSYDVYLTSIFTCAGARALNFGFSDGTKTSYKYNYNLQEVKIQPAGR